MYILYCLINESLKENILSVSITNTSMSLHQILGEINAAYLPTPYTILLTKNVYNYNCIEIIHSLLCKFGKQLNNTFFEISPEIVKQLFDLIHDGVDNSINNNEMQKSIVQKSIVQKSIKQEQYRIIQNNIEYVIPNAEDSHYIDDRDYQEIVYSMPSSISSIINSIDDTYDHLSYIKPCAFKNNNCFTDLDL